MNFNAFHFMDIDQKGLDVDFCIIENLVSSRHFALRRQRSDVGSGGRGGFLVYLHDMRHAFFSCSISGLYPTLDIRLSASFFY